MLCDARLDRLRRVRSQQLPSRCIAKFPQQSGAAADHLVAPLTKVFAATVEFASRAIDDGDARPGCRRRLLITIWRKSISTSLSWRSAISAKMCLLSIWAVTITGSRHDDAAVPSGKLLCHVKARRPAESSRALARGPSMTFTETGKRSQAASYCQMLVTEGIRQAAACASCLTSIPSVNRTPKMTFGRG